ncbi:endosome-associated-trafficking regulator 1 isoform X6 [Anguilla rostrata]|uniref:endosome-associated-trafficking regulator 1 isoform X6 n=1 Tax=Anguilla rostrata TaxID=7938 RepID=UPI0030CD64C5
MEFIRSKNLSSICGGDAEQKSHLPLELREENAQLRNHVKKLLKKSESDNQWIRDLKEQLHKQKLKEEREAQALETMVQSVEQNLQKMTKRAIKAETNASNLKQELLQLQDQLEVYRSDNERLRAAETTALNAMKQNAQIASEYLSKAANNAQTSIRQLLSDAETISLVSKMLYSIDKISDAR